MKCPHCLKEINDKIISKYFASKGGSASRRKLSSNDAKKMALKSAEKRRKDVKERK